MQMGFFFESIDLMVRDVSFSFYTSVFLISRDKTTILEKENP